MKGQKGEHKDLWGARSPRRNPCWLCSGQWEFYLLAAVVIVSGLVGYRYSIIGRDHGIEGGDSLPIGARHCMSRVCQEGS